VVTDQGYGKRTRMKDYPVKGRGGLGVKTVQLTKARGQLAGALPVSDGMQVMLMSNGGTVIRMPVEEIKRLGRSTQGVIVMRLRGDEQVSGIALVAESEEPVETDEAAAEPESAPEVPSAENGNLQ
jgi:DNA gyrase subunit A